MTTRLNLTKPVVGALEPPETGRTYVYDSKQPGLCVCITAQGTRTWYLYRKVQGRPERVRIGPWPAVTTEQARTEAARIVGAIAGGENPNDPRRTNRKAATLRELFDEYLAAPSRGKAKRPRSPRTVADYRWQFDKHLAGWVDRRITQISRQDVERWHNDLGKASGPYLANRCLALVKALFGLAVERGYIDHNPAARLKGFEEQSRDRFLNAAEVARLLQAVQDDPAGDFVLISMLTGCRRGNVLAARWADIDLEHGVWRIPLTKSGRAQNVVLVPQVVALLRQRREVVKGEWVFPGANGGPMGAPRAGWLRILKKAGLENVRMHDLRRTLGSWQTIGGTPLAIVGKTLGHSSPAATAVYARADDSAVRRSVEAATTAMLAAANRPT